MTPAEIGLRERKKAQTRAAIVSAALRLFSDRGFERTTVADIAAAADIAPRTFFGYFPSKEDVLFHEFDDMLEGMRVRVGGRPAGETAIDALRDWIASAVEGMDFEDEIQRCRHHVIQDNDALAARERHLMRRFESTLAEAVAEDLGVPAGDVRASMVATAAVSALDALGEYYKGEHGGPPSDQDPMAVLDHALVFVRGGIAALQEADK